MTTEPSNTPLADQQKLSESVMEALNKAFAVNSPNTASAGTNTSTSRIKLTKVTAREIMKLAAQNAGYDVKFTNEDVAQFIKEFDAEQNRQIEKVITSSAQELTPGAANTEGAVDKTVSSTAKTEYPSFFNPSQFAIDWVWKKVDFKDEGSLGAKSLGVLAEVRGLVDAFQLMGVAPNDIRKAAKQIAMGKKTLDEYKVELQQIAKKEYPQFADRFTNDPTLTTFDIASPIIGLLAKTWEVDPATVKMDDPLVMSYMNYAGADGKGQQPARYDILLKAKKHRKYQETEQANSDARNAATELARAFGFGV